MKPAHITVLDRERDTNRARSARHRRALAAYEARMVRAHADRQRELRAAFYARQTGTRVPSTVGRPA